MSSDDKKQLTAVLECLRYAERELALLGAPVPEASACVGRAALSIEGALKGARGRRRRPAAR